MSELQQRLHKLISYSSQLIFVSSDNPSEQQSALHNLLSQQSDSTEVAFVHADPDESVLQYRRTISQQLLGLDTGMYKRPLNELLSPLNHHDGPVLICVTQADCLTQGFLQELWDLVLQSRFANNRQHLNILLFGKSEWAATAKSWLPSKNRDKPILISSESVAAQPASQLDKMIAEKRRMFEERMRARSSSGAVDTPSAKPWWFWAVIGITFLATFAGIMGWQYASEWDEVTAEQANNPVELSLLAESTSAGARDNSDDNLPAAEADQADIQSSDLTSPPLSEVAISIDQRPVMNWQTDRNTPARTRVNTQTSTSEVPAQGEQTPTAQVTSETDVPIVQSATPLLELDAIGAQVEDYPVEDIVSVSQLSLNSPTLEQVFDDDRGTPVLSNEDTNTSVVELAEAQPVLSSNEQPTEPREQLDTQAISSNVATTSESTDELTPRSINAVPSDLDVLANLPADTFVIQIAGMSSRSVMNEFIFDNQLQNQVWIYTTQRFGEDWHVLIYQQTYPTLLAAREASLQLPLALQRGTPFVKSAQQIKSEL